MVDETLQAAFEIKTACDEISRKLLRWHWEQKPGAHSLDALLKHLAQRQKESPDYYDRMPDLSGKTSWQQLDTTLCMRVLLDPKKTRPSLWTCWAIRRTPRRPAGPATRCARPATKPPTRRTAPMAPRRPSSSMRPSRAWKRAMRARRSRPVSWSSITGWRRISSAAAGPKPLASAKAEEEEPRASTRNRNGTKPRSQSRGSGSSRSGNARRTNSGRSAGRGNGSRSRGSSRKKQRRVHYSRKMAVVLVAAVVLGLVVRAVSMGLFAK